MDFENMGDFNVAVKFSNLEGPVNRIHTKCILICLKYLLNIRTGKEGKSHICENIVNRTGRNAGLFNGAVKYLELFKD